jgi:hypothetical protein
MKRRRLEWYEIEDRITRGLLALVLIGSALLVALYLAGRL